MVIKDINWIYSKARHTSYDPDSLSKYTTFIPSLAGWNCSTLLRKHLIDKANDEIYDHVKSLTTTFDKLTGTVNNVYFSPFSNYPRFKFNSNSSLKRVIKYEKSDIVITDINNISFANDFIIIFYSKSENKYYGTNAKNISRIGEYYSKVALIMKNEKEINEITLKFMALAINEGIIPSDSVLHYFGKCSTSDDEKIIEFIQNLFDVPKQIITDQELDKQICKSLPKLTSSEVDQISNMLKSTDDDIVSLGITMLSSFDVTKTPCTIGLMLAENMKNIKEKNAFKSVAFAQLLSTLKLSKEKLESSRYNYDIYNSLYKLSQDDEDKNNCKEIAKRIIFQEIQKSVNYMKNEFSEFNINVNITVE